MTRLDRSQTVLVALAVGVAIAVGLGVGAVVFADATPESLQEAAPVTAAPVAERSFEDKHTVEVALTLGADTALTAAVSGRVTALSCQAGGTFVSGKTNLSIDGQRILGLATSVPLWRDLNFGDSGEDVTALQKELHRLGYKLAVDGTVGSETLAAVTDLFHQAGDTGFTLDTIPTGRVLWLPAPEATVTSCTVSMGANVVAGDRVATLPGALAGAAITRLPGGAVAGDRVVTIDGESVPVDAEGRVTAPDALALIAASPSYAQAVRGDITSITGTYALSDPVTVAVVPPGALYDLDQETACLASSGQAFAVQVVGSELGQSFVTFDTDDTPSEVDLSPDESVSCR